MRYFSLILIFLTFFSCARDEKTIGTTSNPLIIGFSLPYFEKLNDNDYKKIIEKISKDSGLSVDIKTFRNSTDIVEAVSSLKVDVAFLTLNEYLLAREEYRVNPVLRVLRNKGEKEYYSVIITNKKDINNIEKLDNKKLASRSPYSVSSFILPSILFTKIGIKPNFVFSDSVEKSYDMMIKNEVDASALYKNFIKDKKDLIILYEIGPIPNEPVVCRKGLDELLCKKIVDELVTLSKDKNFLPVFNKMADITGFEEVEPQIYRDLHETILKYSKGIYSIIPDGIRIKKLNQEYRID